MRLDRARCERLLERSEHGVLATRHAERGVDAVPVCFVVEGGRVAVPIDRVKAKSSVDLQRSRNLADDPRAALLCDHWDRADWSQLWWARASLERIGCSPGERSTLEARLRLKYPQYAGRPFADVLVFTITTLTGWSAEPADGDPAQQA
jgi:hypothetical protein